MVCVVCTLCVEDRLGCVIGYEASTNAQGCPCTAGGTSPSSHKNQQTGDCARRVNGIVSGACNTRYTGSYAFNLCQINCTCILIRTHSIAWVHQTVDKILHHARRKTALLHCWISQTHWHCFSQFIASPVDIICKHLAANQTHNSVMIP